MTEADRAAQIQEIAAEVAALEASPLYEFRKQNGYRPVIGDGSPYASIMFIGEAPGAKEAQTGLPFVGSAGKVLAGLLASIGLERKDVYITNVVKDRPPDNRDPRADEIALYSPFLWRQLTIIQPKVVATLGRFAMDFVLEWLGMAEYGKKIGELHGHVLVAKAPYGDVAVVPLYHPASAFYNNNLKETLQEDFLVLKQFA